jgi:hypothetical protein
MARRPTTGVTVATPFAFVGGENDSDRCCAIRPSLWSAAAVKKPIKSDRIILVSP